MCRAFSEHALAEAAQRPIFIPDGRAAKPDFDLVEQAFNLFLLRDAEQRVRLIARRQDRMVKEPALNQPRHSPD